jgi:hypothetical protein
LLRHAAAYVIAVIKPEKPSMADEPRRLTLTTTLWRLSPRQPEKHCRRPARSGVPGDLVLIEKL